MFTSPSLSLQASTEGPLSSFLIPVLAPKQLLHSPG